ncbi:MAG: hypothetical protein AVDCRST_MAG41-2330 [uncultured Corynebacteriales bacterium]|uniref:Major facilitator superfamily (MFS) profile domain-containing protein n=1 Tax=uncultured Mycobacteriales bacterium TaxID=581187 RepID=A0A6J4IV77_9ACTN|nr:MAG: hypothetical protein AVDCRST_MAG41-2330 [uncultured Corynebacteriales bacterium]
MADTLWRLSRFRNLWAAQTLSLLGTQVTLIAFPLVVLLMGGSPADVALLWAVEFLPVLLLGLPAGAWVERLPLRPVLLVSDAARTAALLVVPVAWWLDVLSLPVLFAVAFVVGVGTLFFDVAQMSYLPALVAEDQLAEGNAKLEGSRAVAQLGGPTMGGFLVAAVSAPVAVLLDALSYAASFVFLLFVRGGAEKAPVAERAGLWKEVGEGVAYVARHPLLRPLALCDAAANLAFAAVLALQVFYGSEVLDLSPAEIGIVLAVGNAGGLLGAVLSGVLARRVRPGLLLLGSIAVFSVGAAMLPLARGPVGFGAGLFVVYVGVVLYNVVQLTMRQTITPEWLMGRVNATLRFVEWGTLPLGAAVAGLLVAPVGMRGVLWLAAGVCALSILPPLLSPVRSLRDTSTGDPSVGAGAR